MASENQFTVEDQTTDATQKVVWTGTPADGEAYCVEVKAIGKKSDGSKTGEYHFKGLFRRSGASITQVGSKTDITSPIEDDAAWDVTLDASGTDIRVLVTGVAATTIKWLLEIRTKET